MKYCPVCGHQLDSDRPFCGDCGAQQLDDAVQHNPFSTYALQPPIKKRWPALVIGIGAGLLVGSCLFFGIPWVVAIVNAKTAVQAVVVPTLEPLALPSSTPTNPSSDVVTATLPTHCPIEEFRAENPNDGNPLQVDEKLNGNLLSCGFYFRTAIVFGVSTTRP
jgi:hypothetical protein